jgi:hypothetical protein
MNQPVEPTQSRRRRAWLRILLLVLAALAGAFLLTLEVARSRPDLVVRTVDSVRNVLGPAPVAVAEDAFYQAADLYNRLHYQLVGDSGAWSLESSGPGAAAGPQPQNAHAGEVSAPAPTGQAPTAAVTGIANSPNKATAGGGLNAGQAATGTLSSGLTVRPRALSGSEPAPSARPIDSTESERLTAPRPAASYQPPAPLTPLIADGRLPGEGVWQPMAAGASAAGQPVLWQTVFRPDPARPFAHVALVAMDLSLCRLHLVIGTQEPASSLPARGLRTGTIPPDVQSSGKLVAAWNGGFKAMHGH